MTELLELAEKEDISVDYLKLPLNGSMAIKDGDIYSIILDKDPPTWATEKVHLAHELGHCMTGAFYNIYAPLDIREKHETRANRWAYKTLVPIDELFAVVQQGIEEIWELADYFDVPESFLVGAIGYYELLRETAG